MGRRVVIVCAALAAVATAPAAVAATSVSVGVSPRTGRSTTTFTVSLRNPFTTGPAASPRRSETVDVSGPHRSGCLWSGAVAVPAAPAGQLVRVSLSPLRLSTTQTRTGGPKRWCAGTFRGGVVMTKRFVCPPLELCPLLEIRPQTIARFSYRVRAGA